MTIETQRAVQTVEYGDPGVLRVVEVPPAQPDAGQVVVRPHLATVNAIDWKSRRGDGVPLELPALLGWDVVGVVSDPNGTNLHAGQAVFGMLPFPGPGGTYAEEVVIDADALLARPTGVPDSAVAGVMVALTAWQSLVTHAGLRRGDRLLVHGAAGGVGHMAVQIGAALGAAVIGTVSPGNSEFVTGLGAAQTVDYHGTALDELDPVDVALDTRGGADFFRLLELVRPGGSIVTLVGDAPGHDRAVAERGVRVAYPRVGQDRAALDAVTALFAGGQLQTHIDSSYRLEQAADAHVRGEGGHVRGVIVLEINGQEHG